LIRNLTLPIKYLYSSYQANKIIQNFKPQVVVGVGGYASLPVLEAAIHAKVPTVICEQNAFPGLVNRRLAPKVDCVLLGNKYAEAKLKANKIIVTGNPVRQRLQLIDNVIAKEKLGFDGKFPVVFVTGGSLGARNINLATEKALTTLQSKNIQVLWQCGKIYKNAFEKHHRNGKVHIQAFIDDMAIAYSAADLVVGRAGAITLAELALLAKPAILIPSPNVADDHQTHNAKSFTEMGAAEMINDEQAIETLGAHIIRLLENPEKLKSLQANLKILAKPDAADVMAQAIQVLIHSKLNNQ
jgi:UDP-N-acetylglucosamine--N-acetylmuramyl-(pentapeptide) pyrophosphoryl-undecaprenol N-acetylglucosamine transferase